MLDSWDQFYQDKYPEKVKRELHIVLGGELKVLLKFLEPTTRKGHKALELSGQPKVIIVLRILRNMKLLTNRNSEYNMEREWEFIWVQSIYKIFLICFMNSHNNSLLNSDFNEYSYQRCIVSYLIEDPFLDSINIHVITYIMITNSMLMSHILLSTSNEVKNTLKNNKTLVEKK
ncbi:hypothetical protein RhiirC2_783900 [Rhizophagus irregularis]|uniref:Uncharacterized protein n=1 Tax=Rhizophagus irregularis TaxID=588596 RepID=A0A2N1MZS7_9GLOM|nr:hypothetical protein RhiirC2_783900 [Rhizophagus irregularis]